MPKQKHLEFREIYNYWFSQKEDSPESAEIHLSSCKKCQKRIRDIKRLFPAPKDASPISFDEAVDEIWRIFERIARETSLERNNRQPITRRRKNGRG